MISQEPRLKIQMSHPQYKHKSNPKSRRRHKSNKTGMILYRMLLQNLWMHPSLHRPKTYKRLLICSQ